MQLSQLEHVLKRPDTYIGSVEPITQPMWVFDEAAKSLVFRCVPFSFVQWWRSLPIPHTQSHHVRSRTIQDCRRDSRQRRRQQGPRRQHEEPQGHDRRRQQDDFGLQRRQGNPDRDARDRGDLDPRTHLRPAPHIFQLRRRRGQGHRRKERIRSQTGEHLLDRVHRRDSLLEQRRQDLQASLLRQHGQEGQAQDYRSEKGEARGAFARSFPSFCIS